MIVDDWTRIARAVAPAIWLAATAGCGGSPTPAPQDATDAEAPDAGPAPEPDPPPAEDLDAALTGAFVEARGVGPDEDQAYADATQHLAETIYGDPSWARYLPGAVHDRSHDPYETRAGEAGVESRVGLSRERVEGMLAVLEMPPTTAPATDPLARDLGELLRTARLELACARRAFLFETPCPADGGDGDTQHRVAELGTRLVLRPMFPDGIPLSRDAIPLRPPTAVADYTPADGPPRGAPDVPLIATVQAGDADGAEVPPPPAQRLVTDALGIASFPLPDDRVWRGPLRVVVDSEALLGPLASYWPGDVALVLEGRPLTVRRWTALVTERVQGSISREAVVGPTFVRGLQARGLPAPIASAQVEDLAGTTSVEDLVGQLPSLVDDSQGALDVVMLVVIDSEFARRAGAQRVWYEARGSAQAVSTWTGRVIANVSANVTAQGLGEVRADRAARTQLAIQLVTQLMAAIEP